MSSFLVVYLNSSDSPRFTHYSSKNKKRKNHSKKTRHHRPCYDEFDQAPRSPEYAPLILSVAPSGQEDDVKVFERQLSENTCRNIRREESLIHTLELAPLVEGGYFRRTYISEEMSSIYFLLPHRSFSAWHRIVNSDEVWTFHEGCPLAVHLIYLNGTYRRVELGEVEFNVAIPKNTWQAAEPTKEGGFSFVSTVVAPPFTWENFEMPSFEELRKKYPQHEEILKRLTRT